MLFFLLFRIPFYYLKPISVLFKGYLFHMFSLFKCHSMTVKVPINPKLFFSLTKYLYNSEQNGAKIFVIGQNRNFL